MRTDMGQWNLVDALILTVPVCRLLGRLAVVTVPFLRSFVVLFIAPHTLVHLGPMRQAGPLLGLTVVAHSGQGVRAVCVTGVAGSSAMHVVAPCHTTTWPCCFTKAARTLSHCVHSAAALHVSSSASKVHTWTHWAAIVWVTLVCDCRESNHSHDRLAPCRSLSFWAVPIHARRRRWTPTCTSKWSWLYRVALPQLVVTLPNSRQNRGWVARCAWGPTRIVTKIRSIAWCVIAETVLAFMGMQAYGPVVYHLAHVVPFSPMQVLLDGSNAQQILRALTQGPLQKWYQGMVDQYGDSLRRCATLTTCGMGLVVRCSTVAGGVYVAPLQIDQPVASLLAQQQVKCVNFLQRQKFLEFNAKPLPALAVCRNCANGLDQSAPHCWVCHRPICGKRETHTSLRA